MPIPEHELQHNFVVANANTTVDSLRAGIGGQAAVEYIVIALPDDAFAAAHVSEIAAVIARLGPSALALPLGQLPGVTAPTAAVQRAATGFGQAERIRDRQQQRRLVVLEGERPVGLLTNEARGSSAGGLPFDLFGRYQQLSGDGLRRQLTAQQPERSCPACNESFIFYALLPERNAYACPHCHTVLDEG